MEKEELDSIYELIYARSLSWGNDEKQSQDLARQAVQQHFIEGGIDE